jgi:uncharacterized protein (DUF427 family)
VTAIQGPAPGFHRHPNHHISIHPSSGAWHALQGENVLAKSSRALILEETGYGAVVYFPLEDVRAEALISSDSATACPFKGRAEYFRLAADPDGPDVAWTYPSTYDEVIEIESFVAFYADRISIGEIN